MTRTASAVYGIASESHPEIEPLGRVTLAEATAILEDSRTVWPDVYLVKRDGTWLRVEPLEETP